MKANEIIDFTQKRKEREEEKKKEEKHRAYEEHKAQRKKEQLKRKEEARIRRENEAKEHPFEYYDEVTGLWNPKFSLYKKENDYPFILLNREGQAVAMLQSKKEAPKLAMELGIGRDYSIIEN